jgi:hypothetical protein
MSKQRLPEHQSNTATASTSTSQSELSSGAMNAVLAG